VAGCLKRALTRVQAWEVLAEPGEGPAWPGGRA
jgi:hypothetical protein